LPGDRARNIGDYALIGDCETAALVGRDGSIDWLCWPRFHSEACFAALLGDERNGCWQLGPREKARASRRYRGATAILETRFECASGAATLIDFMPMRADDSSEVVRIIIGETGRVPIETKLTLRFDYGRLTPWASKCAEDAVEFVCGPHAVSLTSSLPVECTHGVCAAKFDVAAGERQAFVLRYHRSHLPRARPDDAGALLEETKRAWEQWSSNCTYDGPHRDIVVRSLITIKAMTSRETGGIIASPSAALPEKIGGRRNWDYRFCWLRDATFTLLALLHSGYTQEAAEWRDWLLRAVAGMPREVQPVYGVAGEHRLPEWSIDWLDGFCGSRPVLAGNAAHAQLQIDVYGEVLDALHQSRTQKIPREDWSWRLQQEMVEQVERIWQEPDSGIWEARHGREHFTHSRVMAWVAVDRAIRAAERHRLDWPLDRWRLLREVIHQEVCEKGYDAEVGGFIRSYETHEPDAALLLVPIVGFLPPDDARVRQTVKLIEKRLMPGGFVLRYDTSRSEDGLPKGEGAFLPCSFWYVDNLVMQEREREARAMFEKLLTVCNDVGLLSEEYDPEAKILLGNFPQGLSHLSLVNSAHNLAQAVGPAHARAGHGGKQATESVS
jgi:GH15 family glucan-1,4-alpha-glucosidase